MAGPFKRILFSLSLIFVAAAVLLWSDRHNRHGHAVSQSLANAPIPLAILQHSSNPIMDEVRDGVLAGLKSKGYSDGQNLAVTTYNAEGDLPTGNLMAQKIAGGDYKLAVSISTVMLQALANANRDGKVVHVFGAVTSPVASGVGIKALDSLDKPPYLTGIGTPQPVKEIFRLAKQINPALKTVGVVWNPAEVNSEICTKQAREVSKELDITLLEAPIEQGKDVREAAASLAARGAEAFWTGGDATVIAVVDSLLEAANAARIPVFSNVAGHAQRGALFAYGADYFEVGEKVGQIAGDILAGGDAAKMPVSDFVPKRIVLNDKVRTAIAPQWTFAAELRAQAYSIIDISGKETDRVAASDTVGSSPRTSLEAGSQPPGKVVSSYPCNPDSGTLCRNDAASPPQSAAVMQAQQPLTHKWKIKRLMYVESAPAEDVIRGIDDGFKMAGLQKDRDFTLSDASAQGDMITLSTLADAVNSDGTELLMTLSTPTLQTVLHKVTSIPIVFTFLANPAVAGAGSDNNHHLPKVTGVYTEAPFAEMVDLLATYFPQMRTVGTLFTPVEDNSVHNKDLFVQEAEKRGITVVTLPVNSPGELPDAALAMASRPVDAWVQTLDNQTTAGFSVIAQAASRAKKPLFAFTADAVAQGAIAAYTMDYYQAGVDAALKAAEVMRGKSPADIPFTRPSKIRLIVSEEHAKAVGVALPAELLAKADKR